MLKLGVMAVVIETVIGISAGVLAGIRRGKFIDNLVTVSTLFLISIPIFVIGSFAQLIFGCAWAGSRSPPPRAPPTS